MNQSLDRMIFTGARPAGPLDGPNSDRLLGALWRRKLAILAGAAVAGLVAGGAVATLVAPTYRATAAVMLDTREKTVVNLNSVLAGLKDDTSIVNTEVEVLRSRSLAGELVDTLSLTEDPEFNAALRPAPRFDPAGWTKQQLMAFGLGSEDAAAAPDAAAVREAVITTVLDRIEVRNIPSSLVFAITAEAGNPARAAELANMVAEIYVENQLEAKFSATENATAWLSEQVAALKERVEDGEARIREFVADHDLADDARLEALNRQLIALRARGVDRSLSSDARVALAVETTRLSDEIRTQSEDRIQLAQLRREMSANSLIYETFLARLKETSVQQGLQRADSQVISPAAVPRGPAAPKPLLAAFLGAILGASLIGARILWSEGHQSRYRTAGELEADTGRTVLGRIPALPGRQARRAPIEAARKPRSALAEAVRDLRTSLLQMEPKGGPQVVTVTSSTPEEGKTMVSVLMAQSLAAMGRRVLLIDCDVRRRSVAQVLRIRGGAGLLSVLARAAKPEDAAVRPEGQRFDVLISEPTPANPADVFATAGFARFLSDMRDRYDHVILDTAPVLLVPDARILAVHTDAVLYLVRWGSTERAEVQAGLDLLRGAPGGGPGLVLTRVDPRRVDQYGDAWAGTRYSNSGYFEA